MTRVVILAGGTGGAKLAAGLQAVLPPGDLTVIVNTGDDVERHGLLVMPDHDAVLYMLGRTGSTTSAAGASPTRHGPSWTASRRMAKRAGSVSATATSRPTSPGRRGSAEARRSRPLSRRSRRRPDSPTRVLPMTDSPVRTEVRTDDGWLEFQEYFVHRHQAPEVRAVRFDGIDAARPTAEVFAALAEADLIVIGPSNPIVSLGPILAVPAMAEAIAAARARGVAVMTVSGIVAGKALKGPADRMLTSLGHESSALGVARLLGPHTDVFVLDTTDVLGEADIAALGLHTHVTDTIMADATGRARLAADLLAAAGLGVAT